MPSIQLPSGPRARAGAGGRPTLRHACGAEARSVSELRVCTNQTCKRQGSPEVLRILESLELDANGIQVKNCGCLGQCGRGPNAIALPQAQMAFSLGRDLDIYTALTDLWEVVGIDRELYSSIVLRLEGNKHAQAGDFAAARDKYREALALAPKRLHHAIHSNLSLVALSMGDSAEALREAETALALAPPDWTTAKIRVAEACIALGDANKAAAVVEQALRCDRSFRSTPLFESLATRINEMSCA